MRRSKEKVTVKWSKTEKDWITKYPEWQNRNARILGINLLSMMQMYEEKKGYKFRELIENAGFDPDTFTISVNAKIEDDAS